MNLGTCRLSFCIGNSLVIGLSVDHWEVGIDREEKEVEASPEEAEHFEVARGQASREVGETVHSEKGGKLGEVVPGRERKKVAQ